jgi:hypothetical protein
MNCPQIPIYSDSSEVTGLPGVGLTKFVVLAHVVKYGSSQKRKEKCYPICKMSASSLYQTPTHVPQPLVITIWFNPIYFVCPGGNPVRQRYSSQTEWGGG